MESEVRMGGRPVLKLFSPRERDITPIIDGALTRHVSSRYSTVTLDVLPGVPGRCDHFLQRLAGPTVPAALRDMGLDETFLGDQFSTPVGDREVDVVVLSAASDLQATPWVHRSGGWIVTPPDDWRGTWSAELCKRFEQDFEESGLLSADEYATTMRDVIARVRQVSGAHVILFGASTLGEELVSSYFGREDDHRLRAHRFNAAQIRLSMALGVSVVDVDRVIANIGGSDTVTGPLEYTAAAQTAIAEDLAYVLADIGFFEKRPLVAQVGQDWGAA